MSPGLSHPLALTPPFQHLFCLVSHCLLSDTHARPLPSESASTWGCDVGKTTLEAPFYIRDTETLRGTLLRTQQ